jgi:acetylornithine deacetylase/succinyl-diaminopimelate desuccinylase-like protein
MLTSKQTIQTLCVLIGVSLLFQPVMPIAAAWRGEPAATEKHRLDGSTALTTGAGVTTTIDWEAAEKEAVEKLGAYIRVDTSNPPGTEQRGVEWLAKVFDAEGIAYETGESAPGRGNIVARLKGAGGEPALVLLNHIDVVPSNPEFWSVDPFSGVVKDGFVWGRGALDMKSTGIAQLMAFLMLHRMKVPLRRDVIFLATADEEAGGEFGAGWVVKNRPEWIRGAGFLLNEGARSAADKSGKVRYIGVGATEKTPAWLKLVATGTPGHGSVPRPASAVNKLIAALERLRKHEETAPLEVTPPIERAFRSMAAYEEEPWRTRFRDIGAFLKTPNARAELVKRPGVLALLHNTISITGLEGTKKINIIPPIATALLDCRLLPGWTIERWVAEVKRIADDDSIKVEVVLNFPQPESPVDTPLHAAIAAATKELYPQAGMAETVSAGFTDSHFFREKGIVSYGFGAFAIGEEEGGRAHGNDERIAVKAFTAGVRLYWEVVHRFASK